MSPLLEHTVNPRISPRGLICIRKVLHGRLFEVGGLYAIDLFTDSDAIFEKSIPQCIMAYPGYMCIRREVNKL